MSLSSTVLFTITRTLVGPRSCGHPLVGWLNDHLAEQTRTDMSARLSHDYVMNVSWLSMTVSWLSYDCLTTISWCKRNYLGFGGPWVCPVSALVCIVNSPCLVLSDSGVHTICTESAPGLIQSQWLWLCLCHWQRSGTAWTGNLCNMAKF